MADPFVAEIRILACNFPPTGWSQCNGQLLPISQNTALFSLLGTFYGGDGKSTFALPDMQGNAPMHQGQGQGLSDRFLGEMGGTAFVTLLQSEIPAHTHSPQGVSDLGEDRIPGPSQGFANSTGGQLYADATNLVNMSLQTLAPAGGSLPHSNMMPYLVLNFCIAMQGVFPPRG